MSYTLVFPYAGEIFRKYHVLVKIDNDKNDIVLRVE